MRKLRRLLRFLIILTAIILFSRGLGSYREGSAFRKMREVSADYVKVVNDEPYVKINGKWVSIHDVKIGGWNLFEPNYLEYDGVKVPIGDSVVPNLIRVLRDLGFVSSE